MKRALPLLLLAGALACHREPQPPLRLPGLYALARSGPMGWTLELHLAEKGSTRVWELRSRELGELPVRMENGTPVARWSASPERFFSGKPFELSLRSEGLDAPLRVEVPAVQPGQGTVGLRVVVAPK